MRRTKNSLDLENGFSDRVAYSYFCSTSGSVGVAESQKIKRMKKLLWITINNELTERQKNCLKMRYIDKMEVEDIADELMIRPTTVYKHLKQGRERIKRAWSLYGYLDR